jgi:hypothetical protein
MAQTNAERQAAYRAKLKQAAREGKTKHQKERLDVLIPYLAKISLSRVAYHQGLNLTDALVAAIMKMDDDFLKLQKGDEARSKYIMGDSIDD